MDKPYFPFYPADWLSDPNVQTLTLEEAGAYITLLAYMWRDGKDCTLPDDDKYIARLLHVSVKKWGQLRKILIDGPGAVFRRLDGLIHNKRLDIEWKKTSDKISKRKAAAEIRWSNPNAMQMQSKSNANASDVLMQNDAISDPDPESDKKRERDQCVRELINAYEETFGPLRGDPSRLMTLLDYVDKGMEMNLIVTAIHKSSNADSPVNYADSILKNQLRKGITTVFQAIQETASGGEMNAQHTGYRKEIHATGKRTRSITGGKVGRV